MKKDVEHAEKFRGVSLVGEKEMISIVTKTEQKNSIMKAVMAGLRLLED